MPRPGPAAAVGGTCSPSLRCGQGCALDPFEHRSRSAAMPGTPASRRLEE